MKIKIKNKPCPDFEIQRHDLNESSIVHLDD